MSRKKKIVTVVVLIVGISALHYITNIALDYRHVVLRDIYFLPIFLAAFWFGLKGGILASLSATAFYLPFTFIYWSHFASDDMNRIMQMILFNVVAVVIGLLVDRQRAENKRLRETESLAAMGQACSAMAHDIRAPLMAIGGFSRLVRKRLGEENPDREKLEIVIRETERLEDMLKEALDFSRPLELNRKKQDMNPVVRDALSVVTEAALEKQVNIEDSLGTNLPQVHFDEKKMEQLLIDLIMNAIQASPEGSAVSVSTSRNRNYLMIDISDHGHGIPEENREKILQPFFSTKKDGTGLGLPIVKKIVDAHHGRLEIKDNPEKGATFTVMIPLGDGADHS
jgi:two-component system, NtrC family, sensor histidine kinase HydH